MWVVKGTSYTITVDDYVAYKVRQERNILKNNTYRHRDFDINDDSRLFMSTLITEYHFSGTCREYKDKDYVKGLDIYAHQVYDEIKAYYEEISNTLTGSAWLNAGGLPQSVGKQKPAARTVFAIYGARRGRFRL